MPAFQNLVGQSFNSLTVLSYAHHDGTKHLWNCLCKCGKPTTARGNDLKTGQKKSCGCLKVTRCTAMGAEKKTHGLTYTREWNSWISMKQRCDNPGDTSYKNYGGRGITYPKEWQSFETFLQDMGARPEGTSLERKLNDQNYSKENCKWATKLEQGNNKRNNVYVYIKDVKLSMAEAERALGLRRSTLAHYIKTGKIFEWFPEFSLNKKEEYV